MKASLRFRDEQTPLYRVKAPINLFGIPFYSGCSLGGKQDLALHVGTAFDAGPSFRLKYRPNDETVPHTLVVKTGLGSWFSAHKSHITVSAEIDLVQNGDTRIMVKTTPRMGDFTFARVAEEKGKLAKGQKSGLKVINGVSVTNGAVEHANGHFAKEADNPSNDIEVRAGEAVAGPLGSFGWGSNRQTPMWGPKPQEGKWALRVHSDFPLSIWGAATCRWGMNLPAELFSGGFHAKDLISGKFLPTMILDKLSIETKGSRMRRGVGKEFSKPLTDARKDLARLSDDVMVLHAENYHLQRAMDDLRVDFSRVGKKGGKNDNRGEVMGREEILLRAQLFEELQDGKKDGKKDGKGEKKDAKKGEVKDIKAPVVLPKS